MTVLSSSSSGIGLRKVCDVDRLFERATVLAMVARYVLCYGTSVAAFADLALVKLSAI
jgi:hypothetical protein